MKAQFFRIAVALLLVGLVALTLSGCRQDAPTEAEGPDEALYGLAEELVEFAQFPRLDGSTANLPLMRALAMYYTGISADEAELAVSVTTTDYSYYALLDGSADLLIVYEPSAETLSTLEDSEVEVEMKPIGLDALVFICNESNPVTGLTTEEIRGIYTGQITNWSELGGENIEIVPYQRTRLSGSQTLMLKLVMGDTPIMDAPSELSPGAMGGLVDSIVEYQNSGNALGYSVYYYVHNMYALPEIKTLAVDGVSPSNASIQNGSYPFVNEFYAVIRADEPADSLTRQVYDFLSTEQGKALVEAAGYVSLG